MSNKTIITKEPGQPIMRIERVFDAPRQDVFDIFTTKELLEKWWSPYEQATIQIDAREGGRWHFTAGPDVTFYGYIHEFSAPERFVQTEEFANAPERGHAALDRYEFAELPDGKTKMTLTTVFLSTADRDLAIESGMETGVIKSYETIDTLLNTK